MGNYEKRWIKSPAITKLLRYIDRDSKQTVLARSAMLGNKSTNSWRLVLIDDWTRALRHIKQG